MFPFVAISLGFLGSFHCIGMCGPIALSLPVSHTSVTKRIIGILTYNFGRIVTYSFIGLSFGLIGSGFAIIGLQQFLSIFLGVIILIGIFTPNRLFSKSRFTRPITKTLHLLKARMSSLFKSRKISSAFFMGLLNGFLPCGLIYMAVAGATATAHLANGALFMVLFGIGTVPTMLSLSLFAKTISIKYKLLINRAVPVFLSFMAVLLIVRGLNLGIPYLSPKIHTNEKSLECHNSKAKCVVEPKQLAK